jgi:hypothetical protein
LISSSTDMMLSQHEADDGEVNDDLLLPEVAALFDMRHRLLQNKRLLPRFNLYIIRFHIKSHDSLPCVFCTYRMGCTMFCEPIYGPNHSLHIHTQ